MENQYDYWSKTWKKALPALAIVGPACWFFASLTRAFGIGLLPGDLSWASGPEGVIMSIGAPFFVATFIYMGQLITERSPKTGILVTILGVLGTTLIAFISGFRALAKGFVEAGVDPNEIHAAFESESAVIWLAPILVYNLCQFLAWILAGTAIIRKNIAPLWVGLALILGVPCLITAQAFYFNLEIFWPLANGLWLLGIWGLTRFANK